MFSAFYNGLSSTLEWFGSATHVEVDDFRQKRNDHKHKQDVEEPVLELRFSSDLRNNS